MMTLGARDDRTPRAADSRIDYYEVYGPNRKVRISLRNRERGVEQIKCLYGMRNVNNLRIRHNVKDDSLHHPDKVIIGAEISCQRNNRPPCHLFLTLSRNGMNVKTQR